MKALKKNQFIIYVIALMLVAAGYLNYSGNIKDTIETSIKMNTKDDTKLSDIGDATLVNSYDVEENNINKDNKEESEDTKEIVNDTKEEKKEESTVETNTNTNSEDNNEYFSKSKLERDTMYSQMIETYEKILNSESSIDTQKQTATDEIKKINELKNKIMIVENLLQTKGFDKNIIFVNGESTNVVIEKENISQEEIAQIQNIVSRELNVKIENIHITNKT